MDELLENLARSQDKETVASTNEYFASCIENEEFGTMIVENLQSTEELLSEEKILTSILGLFSNWISVHWKHLNDDFKSAFFELITISPIIFTSPTLFTKRIEKDYTYRELYEQHIYQIIEQLNDTLDPSQLASYTYLLMIIIKKYRTPQNNEYCDPEELYNAVKEAILPILQSDAYIQSPKGPTIARHIMSMFLSLFKRLQKDPDELTPIIDFVITTLDIYISGEEIQDSLISKCCSCIMSIFCIQPLREIFSELRESLFGKYVQALSIALEQQKSSNLIYWLLRVLRYCCDGFPDNLELLELFISASRPLPSDLQNFEDNPLIFYEDIYGLEQNTQVLLARSYVGQLMEYEDCAQAFLGIELDETIIRVAAVAIPAISEYIGFEDVNDYVLTALGGFDDKDTDEMIVAAQIALALGTVAELELETQELLMESIPLHMHRNPVLTCLCADLTKALLDCDIYPEADVVDGLVAAIPEIQSQHVIECLALILQYLPNEVFPRAAELTRAIIDTIRADTESIRTGDLESNTLLISSLDMLAALIAAGKSDFVISQTIEPVRELFKVADEDGVVTALLRICVSVFGTDSEAKQEVLEMLAEMINENEVVADVIDEYFDAVMSAISHPGAKPFAECGVGQAIVGGAIKAISERGAEIGVPAAFDLIAWTVLGEPAMDTSELLDFAMSMFERADELEDFELFGILEAIAAVTVASGFMPPDEVISAAVGIFRDGMIYRGFDRLLFMYFVCQLLEGGSEPTELAAVLVEMLIQYSKYTRMSKAKREKAVEKAWDCFSDTFNLRIQNFKLASPLDGFELMERITSALQHCPRDLLLSLHETYPAAFNDDE